MLLIGDLAPAFRARPVFGRDVVVPSDPSDGPLVLFFVRHLGSPFARATLAALDEHFADLDRGGVRVAAVGASTLPVARDYVPRHHVLFPLVADSEGELAALYGVGRDRWLGATVRSLLSGGLSDVAAALRRGQGRIDGDPLRLGAEFVISAEGRVEYAHYGQAITELPDLDALLSCALSK